MFETLIDFLARVGALIKIVYPNFHGTNVNVGIHVVEYGVCMDDRGLFIYPIVRC